MDIFSTSYYTLILLFLVVIYWIVGILLVGGFIYPITATDTFAPSNNSSGLSRATYYKLQGDLWNGIKWTFYILIGMIFSFFTIKLLYEKEEFSIYR